MLEERGDVLLVAAEPVETLGEHHVEAPLARILEQLLVAGPQVRGAALGAVGVDLRRAPALPFEAASADADLVLDRGIPLQVRRVAGIDGSAQHQDDLPGFSISAEYRLPASIMRA